MWKIRPVPKSISGPCLAKLAHQLVSKYYLEQKQENLAAEIQVDATESSPCGLEESVTKKETNCERSCKKKRKRTDGDSISTETKQQRNRARRA